MKRSIKVKRTIKHDWTTTNDSSTALEWANDDGNKHDHGANHGIRYLKTIQWTKGADFSRSRSEPTHKIKTLTKSESGGISYTSCQEWIMNIEINTTKEWIVASDISKRLSEP